MCISVHLFQYFVKVMRILVNFLQYFIKVLRISSILVHFKLTAHGATLYGTRFARIAGICQRNSYAPVHIRGHYTKFAYTTLV